MQVKKFEAPTIQEALNVIKRELGPDAVILSTKQNRSGFGLMSKASVEVTVAIAEKDLKKKQMAEKHLPQDVKEKIWSKPADKQAEIYDNYFERQLKRANSDRVELGSSGTRKFNNHQTVEAVTQRQQQQRQVPARVGVPQSAQAAATVQQDIVRPMTGKRYADITDDDSVAAVARPTPTRSAPVSTATQSSQNSQSNDRVRGLEQDIESLKNIITELSANKASAASAWDETEQRSADTDAQTAVLQDLIASGLEKKIARKLMKEVLFELSPQEQNDESILQEKLAMILMKQVYVKDLLENVGAANGKSSPTVVALVGPTGVGKTTTIAKIASQGILDRRLRVGLINLDSYKVAAADQLSTYARIMNVPFRSVTTQEELNQAIYDFGSLDLIMIDTTGRSQKDQESLMQLRQTLSGIQNLQSVLMVSAATRDSDLNDVVGRFKLFSPVGLVFSKLDETSIYGCIYNMQQRTGLPLLYFTVGQRVPEDIERASPERVVDLILDL